MNLSANCFSTKRGTNPDNQVEVFITDSRAHYDKRPWFDMKKDDIEELAKHPGGFVIFVLGDAANFLFVPVKDLNRQLENYVAGNRHVKRGFYHFNLRLGGKSFEQLPDWNLHPYKEKIELIPPGANRSDSN